MLSLIPWTRNEANLFRMMDDMEKNFFNSTVSGSNQFRCDISEKDGNYLLEAELPGFEKQDISIELNQDTLCISATKKTETENKEGQYIRRERRFGSFSRSFDVSGIDTSQIKADYQNGVLQLVMPKAKEIEPATRKIEIGTGPEHS